MLDWLSNLFAGPFGWDRSPLWLETGPRVAATLWFAAVGGCVGSFLNVVSLRGPKGEDVVYRPSACPVCGHRIRWRHNLPVVGWLILRGRCYDCHTPIPVRYWLWEVAFAVAFAVVGMWAIGGRFR